MTERDCPVCRALAIRDARINHLCAEWERLQAYEPMVCIEMENEPETQILAGLLSSLAGLMRERP